MKKNYIIVLTLIISIPLLSQENWTIYNTTNSDLTFNEIGDIEFDSQGNKWIASSFNNDPAGIAKFNNTNWTLFNTDNSQGTSDIHKIEFSTGVLENWVSVYATTLIHFSDGTETTINSNHNSTTNVLTIDIPANATDFQIEYYIENSSSVNIVFYNVNSNNIIHQETFSGQMTFNYDYTFFTNIVTNKIVDISIDNLDNKWLGTWQNGLMKFDDINWTNFTTSNSGLPNDQINCIANDAAGNVWIGTSSGLTKFDGINWTNYNTTNSDLPTNSIVSIAIDNTNNVWLTTANELVEFTGTIWNIYNDNSVGNWFGSANSLRIDNNNKKWMSAGYGIKSFDGSNWEYFNYLGSNNSCLLDCQTASLGIDTNNDIWVGASPECDTGGLLNFSQCNSYLTSNSEIPNNRILALNIDVNGIKWIGTSNGLVKLENAPLSIDKNILNDIKIQFYPNPINDYLNIEIEKEFIDSRFSIFEISGKAIKSGTFENKLNSIDLENISNGVYFLTINKDHLTKTIKFIK
ncbi:T9SS type A sorting domain-containing protein [Flavivirga jejuensis]|uniref:T9SS type A sorting domain-containing protein n=1 Tax=Flavivirga jejuensis TaxID=870487 RepID=A0ABT8WMS7_9FLAO|nr:T9SS type A sorting domain-containing protein [Flavivirga jejuensis]MDO5974289.1 T9SS type A sorting domain-containing protein [Flavivirga jejuensis]